VNLTCNTQILSTGSYVPERVVTNAEMEAILNEPVDQWLIENVGIRERRFIAEDQTTSDLIVAASQRALQKADIGPQDLDLIIVSNGYTGLSISEHLGGCAAQIRSNPSGRLRCQVHRKTG
jgi:3-oxoacyl-[acyl-carrier-protein] synthase III